MTVLLVALLGGALLERSTDGPPGLAFAGALLVATGALVGLGRPRRGALAFVVAAALLLPAFVLRASEVLVALDLLAITMLLALAAGFARLGDPLAATVRGYAARAASLVAATGRGVVALTMPFRRLRPGESLPAVLRGAAVVVPVVAVLLLLLGAADPVFARIVRAPVAAAPPDLLPRLVVVGIGALGIATLVARARRAPAVAVADAPLPIPGDAPAPGSTALLVGAVLVVALFLVVEAAILFGGRTWFFEQEGLTAATYARTGFWQLVGATIVAGLAIAAAWHLGGRGRSRAFRPLAITLCGLLGIVLWSASARLSLYEWAFGFTWLRILVHASIVVLALLILGAAVAIAVGRLGWIPAVAVGAGVVVLLALNLLDPDAFIARRNLDRAAAGATLDTAVLAELSPDAWPVIADRLADLGERCGSIRAAVLAAASARELDDGWSAWNLARDRGAEALARIRDPASCPQRSGRLRAVFSRAADRRQRSIAAWSPDRRTSGTSSPRKVAGRV